MSKNKNDYKNANKAIGENDKIKELGFLLKRKKIRKKSEKKL